MFWRGAFKGILCEKPLRDHLLKSNSKTHVEVNCWSTVVSKSITDRHFLWGELISNYRYRIELPDVLNSIAETDLWRFQQKISHHRYRSSLEFELISITDADFGLKPN